MKKLPAIIAVVNMLTQARKEIQFIVILFMILNEEEL